MYINEENKPKVTEEVTEMKEETIPIVNVMEEIVNIKADGIINSTDMCRCPRCRADVKALALNNLPTRYVASEGGNVFIHMQTTTTQMQAEIMVAIVEAVGKVKSKPSHAKDNGKLKKVKEKRLSVYGEALPNVEAPLAAEAPPVSEQAPAEPQQSKEEAMAAALAAAKAKAEQEAEQA